MYLRAVGRRFTQMNAYVLVMNRNRCNEAPFRCAAICISVIYRRLLQKLLPSELLEIFFFLIALCSLSAFDDRVCDETTQKNKNDNLWITWGRTELCCYSCLLRLRKHIRLASTLSFFCYLNIEIERKKDEKFDSLLTLALINLEFHTHSLKSHGVSM